VGAGRNVGRAAGGRAAHRSPLRGRQDVPRRLRTRERARRQAGCRMSTRTAVADPVTARYEMVVGLEVHVQLRTRTKAFCKCSTTFGAAPNANTCPVCLALPGSLPVLNEEAVLLAVRAASALQCEIHPVSIFARKNYFYPDLPKGY